MRRRVWLGGLAVLVFISAVVFGRYYLPKIEAKERENACFTLQMDDSKIYTHGARAIRISEGAVVLEEKNGEADVLLYSDFHAPGMTVCENYLAFFEYPATHFYLVSIKDKKAERIETKDPVSGVKLSQKGHSLAICDVTSSLYLYTPKGKLQLTVQTDSPIADAALSGDGRQVGVLLFSAKQQNGFIAEIYRAKCGTRLTSAKFAQSGMLTCRVKSRRMYLYRNDIAVGYAYSGKFHLFPETP